MNKVLKDDELLVITTDRNDGYSNGLYASNNMAYHVGDSKEEVTLNRKQLCKENNIIFNSVHTPQQTHSDIFKEVKKNEVNDLSNCDALYTKDKDIYIGVLTADCLPILIYFSDKKIVAAIHAGWVGSAKLIAYKLVNYLITKEGIDPKKAQVYLCPSIFKEVYEVGYDVYKKVNEHEFIKPNDCFVNLNNEKFLFDNRLFNKKQLMMCGIEENNILMIDECTYQNDNYYSYRRDNITGRQLSLIGMRGNK